MATMSTLQVRRVLSAFRGSSWPVLVDVGERKLVVKLRGTAEGMRPLVAELVVGALADALGLPTPERLLVEVPEHVPSDDPHEELRDLLDRSPGLNLGFRYLEGFRNVTLADAERIAPELAAAIVWLDAFVQNPDRTERNPNLMIKAGRIWLIDHGSALTFHHDWGSVTEQAPREAGAFVAEHLLKVSEAELQAIDAELAPKLKRETLEQALADVPEPFLTDLAAGEPARVRAAYVAYLWKRLRAPRPFVAHDRNAPFQIGR
jgi:hypothetical protein